MRCRLPAVAMKKDRAAGVGGLHRDDPGPAMPNPPAAVATGAKPLLARLAAVGGVS